MKTDNPNRIYLGKSTNYYKFANRFIVRLRMIYNIIIGTNCILIYDIKEFIENNERGRELGVLISTNYDAESDWLSAKGGADVVEGIMHKINKNGIGKEKEKI